MDDTETHTACLMSERCAASVAIDGQVVMQARSVLYAAQSPELFEVRLAMSQLSPQRWSW